MNYKLKDKKINDCVFELNINDGYVMRPHIKDFDIKKISIYDYKLTNEAIDKNFLNRFKKILKLVLNACEEDDTTDTDIELLLGETERLENIILTNYKKHIKLEKVKSMLKEIYLLNQKLKKKQELLFVYENTVNKSR